MRILRLLGLLVATVLLFGTPVVFAVTLINSPLAEDEPAAPALIRPSTFTTLDSRPAALGVTLSKAPAAELLESMSGVVTDIEVRVGDLVSTGDIVFRVGELSVYMIIAEAPLFRPVDWESTGRDVIMVREFLAQTGHLAPESVTSDRFDAELARTVADFNADRGVAGYDSVFSLGAVAWAPAPFIVSESSIELGSADFVAGSKLLAGAQPVLAVEVDAGAIPVEAEGDFVFVTDGLVIPLDDVANQQWAAELRVRLEVADDGSLVVTGSAELATPRIVAAVPVTSVIQGASGSCVVTLGLEPSGETSWTEVESLAVGTSVTVEGGDIGRSFLAEPLPQGTVVLANPRLSEQDLC